MNQASHLEPDYFKSKFENIISKLYSNIRFHVGHVCAFKQCCLVGQCKRR